MNDEKTDAKLRVLLAIYAEYQRDIPCMDNVKHDLLEMDCQVFRAALIKLQNEGLISGLVFEPHNETRADKVRGVNRTHMLPTIEGLKEAERYIETGEASTAGSRLKALSRRAGIAGLEMVKSIAENVLADIIGSKIP